MLKNDYLNKICKKTQTVFATHQSSLDKLGYIQDIENYLLDPEVCNPYTHADILFDFFDLFQHPQNHTTLPGKPHNTEIAVIGGGAAGMAAANLLLKSGFKPVVYEQSKRIGGRAYSQRFEKNSEAFCELGAMRIPESQILIRKLRDHWGIKHFKFPNPKIVETKFDYQGKQVTYVPGPDGQEGEYHGDPELADKIKDMGESYEQVMSPITVAWRNASVKEKMILWQKWVNQFNNVSIFQQLTSVGWDQEKLALFHSLGGGTGGMGPFFESAFLELIRIEVQKVEVDQYGIVGGTEQFPLKLWDEEINAPGLGKTSVKTINNNTPLGKVDKIEYVPEADLPIRILSDGKVCNYKAAILTPTPRAIQMTMDVDPGFFSDLVWRGIRQLTLTGSNKTFILTKTAFWKEDPKQFPLTTTLTDRAPAQIYVFDKQSFGTETHAGVICMNYSWGDESRRFAALNDEQKFQVCLNALKDIYGSEMAEKVQQEKVEISTINWETTYGYNAAWRMADPGQQQIQMAMLKQMMGLDKGDSKGLYLAGEALSHYGLSGWIDGAIKTGMIAAISAMKHAMG